MSFSALHALSVAVLDACVDSLDAIPGEIAYLLPAPARQIVTAGEPVWDCCEQLAVFTESIGEVATRPQTPEGAIRHRVRARIPRVTVVAMITRCLPDGTVVGTTYEPPSAADLAAATEQIHADAWALTNGLYARVSDGTLVDGCTLFDWEGIRAVSPLGGCAGWQATMQFRLDGFNPTLGS